MSLDSNLKGYIIVSPQRKSYYFLPAKALKVAMSFFLDQISIVLLNFALQ